MASETPCPPATPGRCGVFGIDGGPVCRGVSWAIAIVLSLEVLTVVRSRRIHRFSRNHILPPDPRGKIDQSTPFGAEGSTGVSLPIGFPLTHWTRQHPRHFSRSSMNFLVRAFSTVSSKPLPKSMPICFALFLAQRPMFLSSL